MIQVPLVSVVIFTYNHSRFIRETLEGAINQTYSNIEIIVADDCSTDGNIDIIHEYVKRYPELIKPVIGSKNEGITKNANRGMAACKGEYIAMVGGDDVIFPTKIEKQMTWLLHDSKRAICGHALNICDEKTKVTGKYGHLLPKSGRGRSKWFKFGPLFGATSIIIKRQYLPSPVYDERVPIVSDWKLYIDVLNDELEYGYIPEVLGLYRKHSNNVTKNVLRAIVDLENCISICELQYSKYIKEIRKGKSYLVDYGYANYYSSKGDFYLAARCYLIALKNDILNWKALIKLIFLLPSLLKKTFSRS
ncbi:glycosyltransferase [Arsukibacterium sp.]|uniref:glycosyltransferase n=1 Tax=Arsukibacterium sp. TaxID=1977258 RepID=UPI00299EAACC|nr:glycosyltransferase [Arsukibacterium sp.]MDX1538548.1 glycosyltransferase [Arsukibacterium sp.]